MVDSALLGSLGDESCQDLLYPSAPAGWTAMGSGFVLSDALGDCEALLALEASVVVLGHDSLSPCCFYHARYVIPLRRVSGKLLYCADGDDRSGTQRTGPRCTPGGWYRAVGHAAAAGRFLWVD